MADKISKEEQTKWKNKEKELLSEIKNLQKTIDEMTRAARTKDQLIEKLKHLESKNTEEIKILKEKLKHANANNKSEYMLYTFQ